MGALDNLRKLYEKKQQEVRQLEIRLKEGTAYMQALQDSIKLLSKEAGETASDVEQVLRPGSGVSQARDVLRLAGKPLHISELLKQMGKPVDKKSRVSLSSTIAGYVRDGQIFTRPAPNTFGLIEFENVQTPANVADIPNTFGKMQ